MAQKEIEKRLRQYAAACRRNLPEGKEAAIERLMRVKPLPRTRGTLWNFVWEQIGYLGRYCLLWQAVWLTLFCFLMRHGIPGVWRENNEGAMLAAVSLFPPILVLLTVEEITKIYQRSMLEIEYATRYSLKYVITVRMLILCMFHSAILAAAIICLHDGAAFELGMLLVCGFTPMIVMTGILMKLMQHFQGEQLRAAGIVLYVMAVAVAIVGNTEYFNWYQPLYFRIWCMACAVGIVFGVCQFVILCRRLANYEQIAQQG